MDNLCHSFAGAAIAHSGFARRFPRATALAVIGANIPDVDAAVYLFGTSVQGVALRRGMTHGIFAMLLWPLLLTGIFVLWNRRRTREGTSPATVRTMLILATLSVWSHPALDWLNNYGVRLLLPFSQQWFYGDTLFIVDPPLLVLLGAGWWLSSRRNRRNAPSSTRPARLALGFALLYIVSMKGMSEVTRLAAIRTLSLQSTGPRDLMVAPRPLSFLTRDVLVRSDSVYDLYAALFTAAGAQLGSRVDRVTTGLGSPIAAEAAATPNGAAFLQWSRFPYVVADSASVSRGAFIGDARYARGSEETWAGVRVPLARSR